MNLRSPQSLWMNLGEECLVRPSLERSIECDVLVVGSGITGALIAYHLAEQNLDVVVIDRRDIAAGSTPASTALLQYDIDTPLVELRKRLGRPHADAAYLRSRQSLSDLAALIHRAGIKCGLTQRPSLYLAKTDADLPLMKEEFEARLEIGMEVEPVNAGRLQSHFSINRPGAILSRVAYQLDPWRFTKQLLVAAERRGARIFARTPLLPNQTENLLLNQTDKGHSISAEHIVWATGYEAPEAFPEIRHLCAVYDTFVVSTRPIDAAARWPAQPMLWEIGDSYLYARATASSAEKTSHFAMSPSAMR